MQFVHSLNCFRWACFSSAVIGQQARGGNNSALEMHHSLSVYNCDVITAPHSLWMTGETSGRRISQVYRRIIHARATPRKSLRMDTDRERVGRDCDIATPRMNTRSARDGPRHKPTWLKKRDAWSGAIPTRTAQQKRVIFTEIKAAAAARQDSSPIQFLRNRRRDWIVRNWARKSVEQLIPAARLQSTLPPPANSDTGGAVVRPRLGSVRIFSASPSWHAAFRENGVNLFSAKFHAAGWDLLHLERFSACGLLLWQRAVVFQGEGSKQRFLCLPLTPTHHPLGVVAVSGM